jgi:hypothetical protein
MRITRTLTAIAAATALTFATVAFVAARGFGAWSPAIAAESIAGTSGDLNTAALEGCPFVAQRDDILYFASNRAGGMGGLDIWYARRGADGGWGAPVNFVEVNSPANELCPMAHRNGKTFLFVSARPGGCGGDDLYMTRLHATRGWAAPANLGCTVNSSANEASPSLLETELYFSSTRAGGVGDIYVSALELRPGRPPPERAPRRARDLLRLEPAWRHRRPRSVDVGASDDCRPVADPDEPG